MRQLGEAEQSRLEQEFRIAIAHGSDTGAGIRASCLRDPELLAAFLTSFGKAIGTTDMAVAASMFSKRYSSMILASGCYALSIWQVGLNLSLDQVLLKQGDGWNLTLTMQDGAVTQPEGDRATWRIHAVSRLMVHNLIPLFQCLSRYLPTAIMWENAASYVHFYYEKWMDEATTPADRERLEADFRFLTDPDSTAFGKMVNPLAVSFRCMPHPALPGKSLRLRRTCCLYHRLPGGANCITCPSLPDAERQERCAEMAAQTSAKRH